jgi:hypothetical protein
VDGEERGREERWKLEGGGGEYERRGGNGREEKEKREGKGKPEAERVGGAI